MPPREAKQAEAISMRDLDRIGAMLDIEPATHIASCEIKRTTACRSGWMARAGHCPGGISLIGS